MENKTYSEKLTNPKWQRKRLEILKRDKFRCRKCGDEETTLHVHHKIYKDKTEPWEYEDSELITVCEDCHKEITDIRKENEKIGFDEIKIFKSDGWNQGHRIMFVSFNNICAMKIYSGKDDFVVGFDFPKWIIPDIIKIFRKAL